MTYAMGCISKHNSFETDEEDGERGYGYYLHDVQFFPQKRWGVPPKKAKDVDFRQNTLLMKYNKMSLIGLEGYPGIL